MEIEKLVKEAVNGSRTALEGITSAIQDNIYYLSLRMLANPDDAKDATQDILIKVITNLSSFKFNSQFNTWVYRIATNHLIGEKKIVNKELGLTFDLFKEDLETDLQEPAGLQDSPDYQLLLNEVRISCTMAMLLCLKPANRMAYILGYILEWEHEEASKALSISKANFRKQLSRSREKVIQFTNQSCGLISRSAKCHCDKSLTRAIKYQRVYPDKLNFATKSEYSYIAVKDALKETREDLKTIAAQQYVTHYQCPNELGEIIELLVAKGINADNNLQWARS